MSIDLDPGFRLHGPLFSPDKPGGGGDDSAGKFIDKETMEEAAKAYDTAQRPFTMTVEPGKVTVVEHTTPAGEKE